MNVREFPEAGADAVDHLAARDNFFHHPARGVNRSVRATSDCNFLAAMSDARDFREGKRPAIEV